MNNVLRMSRKAFTVTVVAATIAWSLGLSALVTPLAANAATSGSLVRGSLPAVYYVGADGKRYVFPNEKTYKTWYSDFSSVQVITDAELAAMPIGGNVTYKPGVMMVKIQTDPKVYAVDAHGALRWVKTEAAAVALYGSNWNTKVHDVPDAFFVNYTIGSDISGASDFSPSAVSAAASSINVDKNLSATGVTSSLSVSAASSMPVAGTLPKGAKAVSLLAVNVHNGGSSAVTVDSVTLKRNGAGQYLDWSAVYVYNGDARLTTGRTINSTSSEVTIGGLNLSVAAGATQVLTVVGDVYSSATAGDQHYFTLTSLTSGALLASGTPVNGPVFSIAGASAGSITVTKTGTLAHVSAGATSALLSQFQLATSTENQNVSRIALTYYGTVTRDNVSNLVLKQNGVTLGTVASVSSKDQVVFTLATPFYMESGITRTFMVYGDVGGTTRASQTVNFYLDQTSDLVSVGQTYGYGVSVTNTDYTVGTSTETATIDAGKLNIAFNGPVTAYVAPRAQDVELFNMTMTAQSNLEVRTSTFGLGFVGGGLAYSDFENVKLVDTATGLVVAGPYTPSSNTITMTEVYSLSAGQSRTFKLTANVKSSAGDTGHHDSGEYIRVTLNAFGSSDIRNLDNNTYLTASTDIVPAGSIVGNKQYVTVSSLTDSAASSPVAQTYIQGTNSIALMGLNLAAGSASDVKVSQIVLTGYIADDPSSPSYVQGQDAGNSVATIVQTAKLMNGSTQVGSTKSPTSGTGGVLTFDNLNLTIPASGTLNLQLVGNLASGLSNLSDNIKFRLAAASDVTATDPNGNTINPSGTFYGPVMTIASSGSLALALSPDDSDSQAGLVVANTSNVVLAKYKFTATSEELKITKSRVKLVTAANYGTINTLALYDGSTLVGGPVSLNSSGYADFSGVNFVVPKDGSKVLTVKGNLNAVGTGGATSGADLQLSFDYGVGNTAFEARGTGIGSSTLLTSVGSGDVSARSKIIRKTMPTVSLVALPSSTLVAGSGFAALRFTVAADAAGDVSFKKLTATVTEGIAASGITISPESTSTSSLRRVGEGSNLTGISSTGGSCTSASNTCTFKAEFSNGYAEVIPAGTSRTYDLRLTLGTAASLATADTLSVNLLGDTALVTGELDTNADALTLPALGIDDYDGTAANAEYNFIWSDVSLVDHNDTVDRTSGYLTGNSSASNDWTDGLYVLTLPSDAKTLSR